MIGDQRGDERGKLLKPGGGKRGQSGLEMASSDASESSITFHDSRYEPQLLQAVNPIVNPKQGG